jgi:Protein of unknown function (DUF3135)
MAINEPRIRRQLPAFDILADLGRRDPAALQRLGRLLTDDVIRHAPGADARRRLEGLQFRIEMERRRAPNPLAACARLSQMMFESLSELHNALNEPDGYRKPAAPTSAKIVGLVRPPAR